MLQPWKYTPGDRSEMQFRAAVFMSMRQIHSLPSHITSYHAVFHMNFTSNIKRALFYIDTPLQDYKIARANGISLGVVMEAQILQGISAPNSH